MVAAQTSKRDEFLEWLLLTDGQRAANGLPKTREAWSKAKGTSTRTLRRWENEDEAFQAELAERKRNLLLAVTPGSTTGAVPAPESGVLAPIGAQPSGGGGDLDSQFQALISVLNAEAASGSTPAIKLALETIYKPVLEARQASLTSNFRDLSDAELVSLALDQFTDEEVAGALTARGWTCVPPEPSS